MVIRKEREKPVEAGVKAETEVPVPEREVTRVVGGIKRAQSVILVEV